MRSAVLLSRALDVLELFPEELRASGPCAAYVEGLAEIEDLGAGLRKERDPVERRAYRADIRRALKKASRSRSPCSLRLTAAAQRLTKAAGRLPAP